MNADTIKKTLENTTQYARLPMGTLLKRAYKSANPALNVHRRSEPVACDLVYSDTPAVASGATSAAVFTGLRTKVVDAYGLKSDKQFVNSLEDNIRERGAPNKLISDRGQVHIGTKVLDILRALFIGSWQSEPHQQQQNPFERRYQTVKTAANRVMDRSGAPACAWLLCLQYVCFLLNHSYDSSLCGIPLTLLLGVTVDTSAFLRFHFWQEVYYLKEDYNFPSDSKEGVGRWVGISEHVGPAMTYKIYLEDTRKVIFRSQIRAATASDLNLRADPVAGENLSPFIKSCFDPTDGDGETNPLDTKEEDPTTTQAEPLSIFDPESFIGRTFLMNTEEDGQRFRARIVELVQDHESNVKENPERVRFLCSINDNEAQEIISYNQVIDHITRDEESDVAWRFKRITSHQGPLKPHDPDYKNSSYNVMIEWEGGEITSEPLDKIAADDPVTCAVYARDNGLLEEPGWKRFRHLARREKKLKRMINQAKLRSYNTAPKYMYGFEVPRNYPHAVRLDERNGNRLWQESTEVELHQIDEYEAFRDLGHKSNAKAPAGSKLIRVHLVFAVKHDGRHKARLVADGHLTDIPLDSVYSGVVSLRGLRLVIFLAELHGLQLWATDIGNAYLESFTNEKVHIIGGPEFGDRQDHVLVIQKALYGLRSSGKRWYQRSADCLRTLGFTPCKAEPDIWMRRNGEKYDYVGVYVDDLAIAMGDPQTFIDALKDKYKFKLKGTGPIKYHLLMDFFRDDDGVLCGDPRIY